MILPADRVTLTIDEEDKILRASTVVMAQCARPRGVIFVVSLVGVSPIYESEHYFGPWTTDQARQFGFVEPAPPSGLVGFKGAPPYEPQVSTVEDPVLTEADYDILAECENEPEGESFRKALYGAGPWVEELSAVNDSLPETKEARALLEELGVCYRDQGLTPYSKDLSWPVGGRGDEISEAQIELALKVVECKNSIDFTRRMATLESQMQAPIITKYGKDMLAHRQLIDSALVDADKVIEEYRQSPEYQQRQAATPTTS